ncbi:MAG: hypothetical protein K6T26_00890 [Alicyclobacillus sp.]|nr:hypothetical protein [Alicyclobacillus sp.]
MTCLTLYPVSVQQQTADTASSLTKQLCRLGEPITTLQAATESCLAGVDESVWQTALAQPALRPLARVLTEYRQRGQAQLPGDSARLLAMMLPDAYHAWEQMYKELVARMRIPVAGLPLSSVRPGGSSGVPPSRPSADPAAAGSPVDNQAESAASLANPAASARLLTADQLRPWLYHPHRLLRAAVWRTWEQAWQQYEDLLARCLNHLAGVRLAVYAAQGRPDALDEPLQINRCSREVLAAMEAAVAELQPLLHTVVRQRARHLGSSSLDWHDLTVPLVRWQGPVPCPGVELATWITEVFSHWNKAWGERVKQWITQGGIQVGRPALDGSGPQPAHQEDRRAPGAQFSSFSITAQEAFCVHFPLHRQVRIHVPSVHGWPGVLMLAHELGHACHQAELMELPPLLQSPAVCVAEAAALWAEGWVLSAALAQVRTPRQRQYLLDLKARRVLDLLAAARARLQFERAFYTARQHGWVPAAQLNELTLSAQRTAFGPGLRQGFPLAWAAQGHAFNTRTPFYDLAYFMGYLLSAALHQRTQQEGPAFAPALNALLRDSGQLPVAELVHKTLHADAGDPAFWVAALRHVLADLTGGITS